MDDETFQDIARTLGVPQDDWDDPAVRELVGFIDWAEQLQEQLANASTAHHYRDARLAPFKWWPDADGASEPLSSRYRSAELLLRVLLILLEGQGPDPQGYCRALLNSALRRYGLKVVPRRSWLFGR
jgi:hypothetical protein